MFIDILVAVCQIFVGVWLGIGLIRTFQAYRGLRKVQSKVVLPPVQVEFYRILASIQFGLLWPTHLIK